MVLPTKIERNMWFYSIRNLKHEFNKVDFDELKEVKLKAFQIDYKISNKTRLSFDLPVELKRSRNDAEACYCSIQAISKCIAKSNHEAQNGSRRSTIDFNELSQLSDEESNTLDPGRVLPVGESNRSETKPVFFDQPIPAYNDDRETQSLRLSSQDLMEDISNCIKEGHDWTLEISKI